MELKKEIKRMILDNLTYINRMDEYPVNMKETKDIFLSSLNNDRQYIEGILSKNPLPKFKKAVEIISNADKIFFHAIRNSIPITMLFYYFIKQLKSHSFCLIDNLTLFDQLVDISSSDLLITVNFPRYSTEVKSNGLCS